MGRQILLRNFPGVPKKKKKDNENCYKIQMFKDMGLLKLENLLNLNFCLIPVALGII